MKRPTPADGQAPVTGGEVKDGHYSVRAPFGVMKVSISAAKVVGHRKIYPTPNGPEIPVTAEALPARYNQRTELVLEVKPGTVSKDWELKSR
jgi:hypothetical protein